MSLCEHERRTCELTRFSHIDAQNYRQALSMTEELLKELKQLDDKIILTEVFLLESRAAHAIQNLPRSKVGDDCFVSLTSSRLR